ncbi:MAG: ferritin [Chloroflexi bacterium]|nr:ferritin [Chloroflexota bacterium]
MLSKTIQEAINTQIKHEFYSSYLYLSMAAYFEANSWPGLAVWMRVQSGEEMAHARKFFEYIVDRGGRVVLEAIDAPPSEFKSVHDVFQQVLVHEQEVTALINDINALAIKENDYATQAMLQWFINEQVEEEKNASLIVDQLKRIGESSNSLFMLDHRLGKRGTA